MNGERIKLEPIQKVVAASDRKLRVCAYARVSTETEEQKTSFDTQVKYYSKLIAGKSDWEFAGIYADAADIIGLNQNPFTEGNDLVLLFLIFTGK